MKRIISQWNSVPELMDLTIDCQRFEQKLTSLAARLGLNLQQYAIDHVAVRCHQALTAARWFAGWQQVGECFKQSQFNGRKIALFELAQPLTFCGLSIHCLELPWPGQRHYPHEGWEHIEIVLPGPADTLPQRALSLLKDEALASPDIRIKQSAPEDAAERLPNPTLAVTDGQVTIKFHPHSLREVVASERR